MKIDDEVYVHGYIDEIRKDVILIRNSGSYFGTIPEEVIPHKEPTDTDMKVVNIDEQIEIQMYDDETEEWSTKTTTIGDFLATYMTESITDKIYHVDTRLVL